jgi:LysR family cyn operon transcriptional activator
MDRFISALKLRQLQYFLALADTAQFTKAAQVMSVTQPTLSHQIAELEEQIGTPLFDRLGKTVRLTSAGELFRHHVAAALKELNAGRVALDELDGLLRGLVRIGVIQSFSRTLLAPTLSAFILAHPTIRLQVDEMTAEEIERRLSGGLLDLGIALAPGQMEDTVVEPVLEERMLLVVAPTHELARSSSLRMGQLTGVRMAMLSPDYATRQIIDRYLQAAQCEPIVVCESNSIEVILGTVSGGALAALIPERALSVAQRRQLRTIRLTDPSPVRTSALLWPRHAFRSRAARRFGDMIRDRFLSNTGDA